MIWLTLAALLFLACVVVGLVALVGGARIRRGEVDGNEEEL